jgi:adenine-specific DNA-methyltransferase
MIKKDKINKLINDNDIIELERHLIYFYIKKFELDYNNNSILTKYLIDFSINDILLNQINSLEISNIKDLENYLELMIPLSDRKFNGAFFTPDFIIDYIINEIKPKENETNLDPSCGCGAFLVGLTDYYKKTFNKSIKKILKENIFGSDILEYNIHRTKLILTIYALQNGEQLDEGDFNLYHQDSLRAKWNTKYNNIVGNPPYVKFQDLTDENRIYLIDNWKSVEGGAFNIYFAFFELGFNLMKDNGNLGYITPNNYFTSLSGESLRSYFQEQKCVRKIIDFSDKKVFDAQTYTGITFLDKKQNDVIIYDKINEKSTLIEFLNNIVESPTLLSSLDKKKWRLLKLEEQSNIKTIETIGRSIGDLFNIFVGIATLKDDVFFIDGSTEKDGCFIKTTEKGVFKIEKGVVRSVCKISEFKSQQEIEKNNKKIIFPYEEINGTPTPINEVQFKKKYPKCYLYLLSEKETLIGRDKGKVIYNPFYVWGRTQGLKRKGIKLLSPTFSQFPRFLLVRDEEGFYTNGYGLYIKENITDIFNPITKIENIDVVQKILNSTLMDYYVRKTSISISGGYPCYQKNFIERFTIPQLSELEIQILRESNKIQVDRFLIEKYQLNLPSENLDE